MKPALPKDSNTQHVIRLAPARGAAPLRDAESQMLKD